MSDTARMPADLEDRLCGVLVGTAVGDALGLPAEGLAARTVARRFGALDRFRLLGSVGFVSDDTEQAALVAQSLVHGRGDVLATTRAFRSALRWWFLRLPFGLGLATLRACVRLLLGFDRSGVPSVGNGAAMRMAIVGAAMGGQPEARRRVATALARVTHTDERAVAGAVFVSELAGACVVCTEPALRPALVRTCVAGVDEPRLREVLDHALGLVGAEETVAALALGTDGFVLHSLAWSTWCFATAGGEPLGAIRAAIRGGGDTDTNAAIVGAWSGALHGARALPAALVNKLARGPFGPAHLRALAGALARQCGGDPATVPHYQAWLALLRNLALYPVILGHGFRRLWPF